MSLFCRYFVGCPFFVRKVSNAQFFAQELPKRELTEMQLECNPLICCIFVELPLKLDRNLTEICQTALLRNFC
jgi:hypothetical protein